MPRSLDIYDKIAIFELVVWTFNILGAIFLCVKHGWDRNSGWVPIVGLGLARLVGDSLRLATISHPNNEKLNIGWAVTNGLGLSVLILVMLGLLSRVLTSITRQVQIVLRPVHQNGVRTLLLVAIILQIVGATSANITFSGGKPKLDYPITSEAAAGLMIGVFCLVLAEIVLMFFNRHHIEDGERRILLALALSVPFVAIRLAYSCVLIFGHVAASAYFSLGTSTIMEIIVILIFEITGFSLAKAHKETRSDSEELEQQGPRSTKHRGMSRMARN